MKLSIIIVNYNVKFFLEQCLLSLEKSIDQLNIKNPDYKIEVFVVDNNSVDGSIDVIKNKFKQVKLIENKSNKGFAAANNQALLLSTGEYILLINPDTVVEEFTLQKAIDFMDTHPEAGALGVKMIDGKGNFLPESKRSLPTPATAFFKIFGFSKLFPKSRIFGRYHLGYLDNNKVHEVEVLAGAFMFIRKSVLDKTGFLDETFFMYGEDIDLSYRIISAGYKNFYFPDTQIIHYKGESTKKSSVNYVLVFYKAMIIFARKHFSKKNASLFSFFINVAIYIRAFGAIIHRFISRVFLFITDLVLVYAGLYLVKIFWEKFTFGPAYKYPEELLFIIFPIYVLLWIFGLYLSRGYAKPFKINKLIRGVLIGVILVSIFYAFLEEQYRFSRAIILLGTISTFISFWLSRLLIHFISNGNFKIYHSDDIRIAIVGKNEEAERVLKLLKSANLRYYFVGFVFPEENNQENKKEFIGDITQVEELINVNKINEIIFCDKDIPSFQVINLMTKLQNKEIIFKIAPREALFIIGSNSKNSKGDLYTIDIQLSITKVSNKFYKRVIDILFGLFCLLFSPIMIIFQKSRKKYFDNIIKIVRGKNTFVSYNESPGCELLPILKKGILRPTDNFQNSGFENPEEISECNMIYAKNYIPLTDLLIILKNLEKMGD